jgi:hypothetical protein
MGRLLTKGMKIIWGHAEATMNLTYPFVQLDDQKGLHHTE